MHLKGKLRCVGATDTGRVRDHNEDTIGTDADVGLVVLADGMGGYKSGEVASGIAVRTLHGSHQGSGRAPGPDAATTRRRGLSRPGHPAARRHPAREQDHLPDGASTQPNCEGMGTTVVAGLFFDDKLTIAHVGDSRMYRLRGDRLEQVTQDHSLMQELVARGFYTPEEAARAAAKNFVTRALGVEVHALRWRSQKFRSRKDDLFLLCSDGLSDMVEDDDIQLTISTFGANLETLAKQLVLLSNENGGRDNVSVVLARVLEAFPARRGMMDRLLGLFG